MKGILVSRSQSGLLKHLSCLSVLIENPSNPQRVPATLLSLKRKVLAERTPPVCRDSRDRVHVALQRPSTKTPTPDALPSSQAQGEIA